MNKTLSSQELLTKIEEMSDLPKSDFSEIVGDPCQVGDTVTFSRVVSDDMSHHFSSKEVANIVSLNNRNDLGDDDYQGMVYLSPRRNSTFSCTADDLFTLVKEGWNLYPIDEYEHGSVSFRSLGDTAIGTKKALTQVLASPQSLQCRFDSSLAFLAIKKGVGQKFNTNWIEPFQNWINGYSWAAEVIETKIEKDGTLSFVNSDSCGGYFEEKYAKQEAQSIMKNLHDRAALSNTAAAFAPSTNPKPK